MKVKVENERILIIESDTMLSHSVNMHHAEFIFDPSWSEYAKTVVFKRGNVSIDVPLGNNNLCTIPWEILTSKGSFAIGVYGVSGDKVRPTLWSEDQTILEGTEGGTEGVEPTQDVYRQLVIAINASRISKAEINEENHLIFTTVDGSTLDAGYIEANSEGAVGATGGYYIPSVDENGVLTWSASASDMPQVESRNIKGEPGENGSNGVSPTVAVSKTGKVTTVTITDANSTKTATINDGAAGKTPVKGTDYWTEADKAEIIEELSSVSVSVNQGAANVGKILVVGTDGNLTLADMPEGGANGDVTGVLDESNNILLSGNLADGTYTLKWQGVDGTYSDAGTLEVSSIVTYTVTQNLTKVTSDNSVAEVRKGESITVNLTANSGYNLKTITVTMGGVDITSTAVSGGKVTIASVTGDVVIAAVAEEIKVIEPVTVDIALRDGIRLGSDGGDRTGATGACATERIDLSNIPKPCTINLTKARWAYTGTETGYCMTCARKADGTNLVVNYTYATIGSGYFSVAINDGQGGDVTVTVTSDDVAEIAFSGIWTQLSDSYTALSEAGTKATLTYTPAS